MISARASEPTALSWWLHDNQEVTSCGCIQRPNDNNPPALAFHSKIMSEFDLRVTKTRCVTPTKRTWFEFLLDPSLLPKHLAQADCDPTAVELIHQLIKQATLKEEAGNDEPITKFSEDSTPSELEPDQDKKPTCSKKIKALQLLALQATAYIKWDLQLLTSGCPQALVYRILVVLISSMSTVKEDILRSSELNKSMTSHLLFALVLLNTWNLRMEVQDSFLSKNGRKNQQTMMGSTVQAMYSMYVLEKYVSDETLTKELSMPTYECIGCLNEEVDEAEHHWEKGITITRDEALCQVCFDLGCYYFHLSEVEKAHSMFSRTEQLLSTLKNPQFCKMDKKRLRGYIIACSSVKPVKDDRPNMTIYERLEASKENSFQDVVSILMEDNLKMELTIAYRNSVQEEVLQLQRMESLHFEVATCNIVRCVMEGRAVLTHYTGELIDKSTAQLQFLIRACEDVMRVCSLNQKLNLKCFLRYLCDAIPIESGFISLLLDSSLQSHYSDEEIRDISYVLEDYNEWREDSFAKEFSFCEDVSSNGELSRQLIVTYDPSLINSITRKLAKTMSYSQLSNLNDKWWVPREISQLLSTVQGELSVITFILVAKARHCIEVQLYDKARNLLLAADNTIKDVSYKLCKLIRYQTLVVDLEEFHETGNIPDTTSMQDMVKRCKTCITSLRLDSDMYPGGEVIGQCGAFLLNIRDWKYLRNLSNTENSYLELSRLLSEACNELQNPKGARQPAKALWEAVVSVFKNYSLVQQKRSGHRSDIPSNLMPRGQFMNYIQFLKEPAVLSLMISCMVKLYSLVQNDLRIDISSDHAALWPNSLQTPSDVNGQVVSDAVDIIVKHSLRMFPRQPSWLRTQADIYFANSQYAPALRYYLEAGVVASDFFTIPVPKTVYDDVIYKNMIKCCTYLQCHTQVAVLCQFLDEVDYSTAFKALQEKVCYDAMDAYYDCIWDTTILEFLIYLHNKRGELEQKQKALKAVAQPDLNNSNTEAIQNAAASVRKQRFLCAMAKQYL